MYLISANPAIVQPFYGEFLRVVEFSTQWWFMLYYLGVNVLIFALCVAIDKLVTMLNQKEVSLIKKIFKNMESTFQKVGIVKYDAFQQMGVQLSFSLALLDEKNNGFIINSVHSSEGCYSYTKRIINGDSQIALSNEEKVAVERAMGEVASSETE